MFQSSLEVGETVAEDQARAVILEPIWNDASGWQVVSVCIHRCVSEAWGRIVNWTDHKKNVNRMLPSDSQQVSSIVVAAGTEDIHLSVLVVLEVHFDNRLDTTYGKYKLQINANT